VFKLFDERKIVRSIGFKHSIPRLSKKFEHPPKHVVYYSMNNLRGRLGSTRQVRGLGCDTDSSIFSKRFDARLHGAGINDEENAGQRSNRGAPYGVSRGQEIARLMAVSAPYNMAPHCYRHHGNLCVEEGMHTRSQQIFFGGGETRESESLLTFGEISKLRHPASNSL
jgi:hypothetical protein